VSGCRLPAETDVMVQYAAGKLTARKAGEAFGICPSCGASRFAENEGQHWRGQHLLGAACA